MLFFNYFNVEQELARLGLSPNALIISLWDEHYKTKLDKWANYEHDRKGGAAKMLALRNYNNYLLAQLKDGQLSGDAEYLARQVTQKLSPYLREVHLKYLEIDILPWPAPLKTVLEISRAEKVEPFDGLPDMRQRAAGENRLLFIARDPFERNGILIDVQVALVDRISSSIQHVKSGLDGKGVKRPKVAIFYAISNADKVSGIAEIFLRRVVAHISTYIPSIEFHSTLSPVPGLVPWITSGKGLDTGLLEHAYGLVGSKPLMSVQQFSDTVLSIQNAGLSQIDAHFLPVMSRVAALYLTTGSADERGRYRYANSVANFHLPNGAMLGRIIIGGDDSDKGRRQSGGIMVNYFYNPAQLDAIAKQNRAGKPQVSEGIAAMLLPSTRRIGAPRHDHQFGKSVIYLSILTNG